MMKEDDLPVLFCNSYLVSTKNEPRLFATAASLNSANRHLAASSELVRWHPGNMQISARDGKCRDHPWGLWCSE